MHDYLYNYQSSWWSNVGFVPLKGGTQFVYWNAFTNELFGREGETVTPLATGVTEAFVVQTEPSRVIYSTGGLFFVWGPYTGQNLDPLTETEYLNLKFNSVRLQ